MQQNRRRKQGKTQGKKETNLSVKPENQNSNENK